MKVNGSQHMVLTTYSKTRVCVCVQVTQVGETDPDVLRPGRCLILTIDSGVAFSRRSIPPFSTSCMRDTRRHPCELFCSICRLSERARIELHAVLFKAAFFLSDGVPERISGWWP
ncbi:hypothetical protein AMECASPLE_039097 [Ameca splendens]|uniref:Uncharacterized protein n=1 Tax=Ameca splendens TaxID=208324 RepID=A0ABV0Z686_9TELE